MIRTGAIDERVDAAVFFLHARNRFHSGLASLGASHSTAMPSAPSLLYRSMTFAASCALVR